MNADLIGKKFGYLTVIDYIKGSRTVKAKWKCECECGNIIETRANSLLSGVTKSCGCKRYELFRESRITHGGFGTRLYHVWISMRQRCNNDKCRAYHNYGGRGISICEEWDDFDVFRDWAYSSGYDEDAERGELTLDRIDVNGNYEPDNCRWVDMIAQANNRRDTMRYEYDGELMTSREIAEKTGMDLSLVRNRLYQGKQV